MDDPGRDDARMSRRRFLKRGAAIAGGSALVLGAPAALIGARAPAPRAAGFGAPVEDPGGLLDLPPGFRYRVVSEAGSRLSDGAAVPGAFDGMAAIPGRSGATILVRNHELSDGREEPVPASNPFDPGEAGGTTAVVIGPDRRPVREYVTSSGTRRNCAGGVTPWGTWITCEEDTRDGHGYAFEVDPRDPGSELSRTPIRAMGRFSHEAVGVDPRTGIVYLTEDSRFGESDDGVSFLFRYLPEDRGRRPGALGRGGALEALALRGGERATADEPWPGRAGVAWRTVDPEDAHAVALGKGCARFGRLEGCHFAGGALFFDDTAAGGAGRGRVFRYTPRSEALELLLEGSDANALERPDNVVMAPFGDLWLCSERRNQVIGVTPAGELYPFAVNRLSGSELAGPTFSPDGGTFFVNIQDPGLTFAVWGPFGRRDPSSRA
jgi:secreted PhoX family phosphatase